MTQKKQKFRNIKEVKRQIKIEAKIKRAFPFPSQEDLYGKPWSPQGN
jgi:hypothetical protein